MKRFLEDAYISVSAGPVQPLRESATDGSIYVEEESLWYREKNGVQSKIKGTLIISDLLFKFISNKAICEHELRKIWKIKLGKDQFHIRVFLKDGSEELFWIAFPYVNVYYSRIVKINDDIENGLNS